MSDLVTSRIFSDGEKGITATKMNDIIGGASIQTAFYSAKSTASTADAADTLLLLKAAGSYAQVPVSTFVTSVAGQLPSSDPKIWSVRLRSYNSVGNPNFEVDQRNCFNALTNPSSGTFLIDRYACAKVGTMAINSVVSVPGTAITVPGTNFKITRRYLSLTLATQQSSLGASHHWQLYQSVEGPNFREISNDVHSISILARSSVANLKFSVYLQDGSSAKSLVKLCTLGAANTWTLISLPNLPAFTTGSDAPGGVGYYFGVMLACGTAGIAPAADTWQTGDFGGAPGMDNFASKTVGSTFDLAFSQHEPGPVCSTLMDKPFTQNYDECLRYYQKTYQYGFAPGTVTQGGMLASWQPTANATVFVPVRFHKPMAGVPTVTIWDPTNGTPNTYTYGGAGGGTVVSGVGVVGDTGYTGFTSGAAPVAGWFAWWHHTADTGI